jgi:glycosyltransferase involved in cell wall biosynthesis
MKVLMVTNQYPTESRVNTNPVVLFQSKGLIELGLDIDLFHIDKSKKGKLIYFEVIISLYLAWKKTRYDLMHIQFGGIQALLGSIISKKKCVITFHGSDLHGGTKLRWHERVFAIVNVFSSRIASQIAGEVIVVSQNLTQYLPKKIKEKAHIIHTGVDYKVFQETNQELSKQYLDLDPNKKYILFSDISNAKLKRRDLAEASISIIKISSVNVELLILSNQPYNLVPYYLNAADCLLLTSDIEGSPNIIKEAIATNLPIVSVDVGDVKEICSGIENSFIVERNINEIADGIMKALSYSRLNGGREQKKKILSNEFICRQILQVYMSLLNSN